MERRLSRNESRKAAEKLAVSAWTIKSSMSTPRSLSGSRHSVTSTRASRRVEVALSRRLARTDSGQSGHAGNHMELVDDPDHVESLTVDLATLPTVGPFAVSVMNAAKCSISRSREWSRNIRLRFWKMSEDGAWSPHFRRM